MFTTQTQSLTNGLKPIVQTRI